MKHHNNNKRTKRDNKINIVSTRNHAIKVIESLKKNNLSISPNNFLFYYEKLLNRDGTNYKKYITKRKNKYSELHDIFRQSEDDLRDGIKIFEVLLLLIKNFSSELNSTNKKLKNIKTVSNLHKEINILQKNLNEKNLILKKHYDEVSIIVKQNNENQIKNILYGTYNQNFMLNALNKEIASLNNTEHKSSVLSIKVISLIENKNIKITMNKILLSEFRKELKFGDSIAYIKNHIFIVLLPHTKLQDAICFSESVVNNIKHKYHFIDGDEVKINVSTFCLNIETTSVAKDIIDKSIIEIEKLNKQHN